MSKRTAPGTDAMRLVDLLADGRYPAASRDNLLGGLPEEILTEELMDVPLAQQLLLQSPNKYLAVVARHHLVEHFARVVQENVAAMRDWRASTSAFLEFFVAPLSRVTRLGAVQTIEYATGFTYVGPERRVPITWVLRNADARLLGPAMDEADWDELIALAQRYFAKALQDAPTSRIAESIRVEGITTLIRLIRATPSRVSTYVEVLHRLITVVLDPQNRAFFHEANPSMIGLKTDPTSSVLEALVAEWCAQGSQRPGAAAAVYREINLDSTAAAAYWLTYFEGLLATVLRDDGESDRSAPGHLSEYLRTQQHRALMCLWTGLSAHDPAAAPQQEIVPSGHWLSLVPWQSTYAEIDFEHFAPVATTELLDWRKGAQATDLNVFNTSAAFLFDWTWEYVGRGHVFDKKEARALSSLLALFWRPDTGVPEGEAAGLLRRATRAITQIGKTEVTGWFLQEFVTKLRDGLPGQTLQAVAFQHAQLALLTVAMVADLLTDSDIRDTYILQRLMTDFRLAPHFNKWVRDRLQRTPELAEQVVRVRALCTARR